ncbi:MAG: Na-Ca exchanger/integrin-beta4, partial [Planctomycetota bacterium]|nr:Na-Ca exchanger/integrin-beta4 [Planctomycetota bacterium]
RYGIVLGDFHDQAWETNESDNASVSAAPITVRVAPSPNLVISSTITPPSAFSNEQVLVQWTVSNIGTGATSAPLWYDTVYLSLDPVLDTGVDQNLGQVRNQSYLGVGDSYANQLLVRLPRGIEFNWYMIVVTDSGNAVYEYNAEGDNRRVSDPINVQLTPPPDLRVTNVLAPATAFSGIGVNITYTVTNAGPGPTIEYGWTDEIWLSLDRVRDASDIRLGSFSYYNADNVAANGTYTRTFQVIPPLTLSGTYFFLVSTDSTNIVYEGAGDVNNVGSPASPTTISLQPPPDLEVTAVAAAASQVVSGFSVSVSYTVANNGSTRTPTGSWTDQVYLSTDAVLSGNDVLLGTVSHASPLDTGRSYSVTQSFTVPTTLVGVRYLIVATDAGGAIFELNNSNNIRAALVPVEILQRPADLVVQSVTGPASVDAGRSVLLGWTVRNTGTGSTDVGGWYDRIVASYDDVIGNGDDIALAPDQVLRWRQGALGIDSTYSTFSNITIPNSVSGTIRLFVQTNSNGAVYEGGASTNNWSQPLLLQVIPDYSDVTVTNVVAPLTMVSGSPLEVSWTVQNLGPRTTNVSGWNDFVYLSSDPGVGGGHLYLGSANRVGSLAYGESYTFTRSFVVDIDFAGQWYVIVKTGTGIYQAGNTGNDERASAQRIEITQAPVADLAVTSIAAPTEAISGRFFDITYTALNQGGTAAVSDGGWYDTIYLSLDQALDRSSDRAIGSVLINAGPLGAGASYTRTVQMRMPDGLAGPFYVFVSVDSSARIYERGSELNNVGYDQESMLVSLAPQADLVAGEIIVPANSVPGTMAQIQFTVTNTSLATAAGGWYDSLYISADGTFDLSDQLFARVYRSASRSSCVPTSSTRSLRVTRPTTSVPRSTRCRWMCRRLPSVASAPTV